MAEAEALAEWVILELMGHRRLAGYVTEQTIAGKGFLRLDVPAGDKTTSQFYSPDSVYCITPTTEEIARSLAKHIQAAPVQRWELPQLSGRGQEDHERQCRVCGCTDTEPCVDEDTGGTCHWVENDLCSACSEMAEMREKYDE